MTPDTRAMRMETVALPADGSSGWAGHGSYVFPSPDGRHAVTAAYAGEPPHGDSCHHLEADGAPLPGHAWGGNFAWSPCSRWFVCAWMAERWARQTIVVDVEARRYAVLPEYFHDFAVHPPVITEVPSGRTYAFRGSKAWRAYGTAP